jgi:predicted kinase
VLLPDPSLVVLIGAAGAGKTTFAARHFQPSEVLSSDGFRALIAGDESDQRATRAAFGRLHRDLERRMAARQLTVVDATNVERFARRALLRRATVAGLPGIAIVLDLPGDLVIARNAARSGRMVAEAVVRHHLARLRQTLDPRPAVPTTISPVALLEAEGFAQVLILRDPAEVDAMEFVRVER